MSTRRSTMKSQEIQQPDIKDILTTILEKLGNIEDVIGHLAKLHENHSQKEDNAFKAVITTMNNIHEEVAKATTINQRASIQREVDEGRRRMSRTWSNQLKKRSQHFWQSINNDNTAVIYETWLNRDDKIIPKKFLLKSIPSESNEEKSIRQNSVLEKFQTEINLMKIRANRHSTNYLNVDEEIIQLIDSSYNDEIGNKLKELWTKEAKTEEQKSSKRWATKQTWLENYEKEFKNPDFIKTRRQETQRQPFDSRNSHTKQIQQQRVNKTTFDSRNSLAKRQQQQRVNKMTTAPRNHQNVHNRNHQDTKSYPTHPRNTKHHPQRNAEPAETYMRPTYANAATRPPYILRGEENHHQFQQRNAQINNRERNHFLAPIPGHNHIPQHQFNNPFNWLTQFQTQRSQF